MGKSAIGVIRLSGSDSHEISKQLTNVILPTRISTLVYIQDKDVILDQGLMIKFSGPHSYTGEDCIEYYGHGNPLILHKIVQLCVSLGARLAEAGEFSLRAFHNKKIDLTQAEAVNDLIKASSLAAIAAANKSLSGNFSKEINNIHKNITTLRSLIEANIDFSEEEDIKETDKSLLIADIITIKEKIQKVIQSAKISEKLNAGFTIIIAGPPNVGKSTLFNRLSGYENAIVTSIPGTTRDTLKVELLLSGMTISLADTAGLRQTNDPVELIGIKKTKTHTKTCNLLLLMVDQFIKKVTKNWIETLLGPLNIPKNIIIVRNKADLNKSSIQNETSYPLTYISASSGIGVNQLIGKIESFVQLENSTESTFLARTRHIEYLVETIDLLNEILSLPMKAEQLDLIAENFRLIQYQLDAITGKTTPDDILTKIFSSFCIGK